MANPEQRLLNLLTFFGWQGGTIHQVEAETGVEANTLLYGTPKFPEHLHYRLGREASSSTLEYRQSWAKDYKGSVQFWLGVAGA